MSLKNYLRSAAAIKNICYSGHLRPGLFSDPWISQHHTARPEEETVVAIHAQAMQKSSIPMGAGLTLA